MLSHHTTLPVRFYELDPYNHVNHAVYFSYFETARIEALESVGLGLGALEERGFRIVVTDIEAKFLRPLEAGDVMEITTEVVATRRASHEWRQVIRCDGTMAVTIELRAAMVDLQGRPCRVPDFVEAALGGSPS